MGATRQNIKDSETEAGEFEKTLLAVGDAIRKSVAQRSKSGLSYAEFKAHFLGKKAKAAAPSHAVK